MIPCAGLARFFRHRLRNTDGGLPSTTQGIHPDKGERF